MKKVSMAVLFILLALTLATHEVEEVVVFLILLLLFLMVTVFVTRHIQRYLCKKRFEKDCENIFTEDFYIKLNRVIKK